MAPEVMTAVAFYGAKAGAVADLLESVQAICADKLGAGFRPYTADQMHSTVVRLDGARHARTGLIVNPHYLGLAGIPRAIDYALALRTIAARLTPPLAIRFGGFAPGQAAGFSSRGQSPHVRSFSAQGGALVLVGWPVSTVLTGMADKPLDDLRRSMNEANILHWYHASWDDVDNDAHIVVGHCENSPSGDVAEAVAAVRSHLALHRCEVEISRDRVAVIAADSPTLVPAQVLGHLAMDTSEIVSRVSTLMRTR
jgi:hypothetical protein